MNPTNETRPEMLHRKTGRIVIWLGQNLHRLTTKHLEISVKKTTIHSHQVLTT